MHMGIYLFSLISFAFHITKLDFVVQIALRMPQKWV